MYNISVTSNFFHSKCLQKAEAQLAYQLQAAKIQQRIRNEEIQIQVVERRKQIEIEEQEIKRKEKELTATVKLPSEAEAYKVQTVAEGNRTRVVESAKADGERIRLIGGAEARAVEAVGRAEAESMRLKASAYKQYGDAAVMSLVLEALPSIAAEVAAPLAKTDEIVLIGGGNNTTNEITKLIGSLPPSIQVNILVKRMIGSGSVSYFRLSLEWIFLEPSEKFLVQHWSDRV